MRSPSGRLAVLLAVLGALVAACVVEDAPTPTPLPSPSVPADATPTPTRTPASVRPPNQTATPTSTVVPVLPTYLIPTPTPTPRPRLLALLVGVLVDRDGCLAVVPEHASDPVALIWTREWHVVRREGSNVTVVDTYDGKTTSVTWQLGREVRLGGGTAGPLKDTGHFTIGECSGPYWLVGNVR